MGKDIVTLLGIDGIAGSIIYYLEPTFLKWILAGGFISLIALFYFTRQGRVTIYGTQMVMALITVMHFA